MAQAVHNAPSFFPNPPLDHAVAGIGAGTVAVLCMHPLDLLKVKLQVATTKAEGGIGKQIYISLRDVYRTGGIQGLYRGIGPNIAGNASSWGLYFLLYTMLKRRASNGDPNYNMSAGRYLLCSAEASAVTALVTNPIWVVKVRMFTTTKDSPNAYRGLWHGLREISRIEGVPGLFRGTMLALFGVSNGAIQFMAYEKMKQWGFRRKRRQYAMSGKPWTSEADRLSNRTYTVISALSKLGALALTYPYQVVRSRLQNNVTAHLYPNIRTCIRRTWSSEGIQGFYRGLGTNLVRVLPGTCVTFVVYENITWLFRKWATRREARKQSATLDAYL